MGVDFAFSPSQLLFFALRHPRGPVALRSKCGLGNPLTATTGGTLWTWQGSFALVMPDTDVELARSRGRLLRLSPATMTPLRALWTRLFAEQEIARESPKLEAPVLK
jgi:hypothetical protein